MMISILQLSFFNKKSYLCKRKGIKCSIMGAINLSGGAQLDLFDNNEALCSSCSLKPEKLQRMAREHECFLALAWNVSVSFIQGILRTSS